MTSQRPRHLPIVMLCVAIAYFATGRLGLLLPAVGANITFVWLPTGIAVAALVCWGYRCWPGVALGATALNWHLRLSLPASLAIGTGNTLGTLLAAWLCHRMDLRPSFERPRDIVSLAAAAALGMLVTSGVGVATLQQAGLTTRLPLLAWFTWWAGDFLGVIIAAPLLLTLNAAQAREVLCRPREFAAGIATLAATVWAVFISNTGANGTAWSLAFLPLPWVAWAAVRFGAIGTSSALVVVAAGATWGTAMGCGPFHRPEFFDAALMVWALLATGALIGWLIMALQRRAHHALALHQLSEQALADVSFGLVVVDTEGTITYANMGCQRLTGYRASELLGKSWRHLAGPDSDPATIQHISTALRGGGSFDGHLVSYRKDGSPFWNSLLVSPMRDERGALTGHLCIQRDSTAAMEAASVMRASEERLRLALMASRQGLYDVSVTTGDAIVSAEYAHMLGYDPATFVESVSSWRERLHPDDRERAYAQYADYIAGRHSDYVAEFRLRTKSDTWVWVLSIGSIVARRADGTPLRMLGTHTDITERKRTEQQLRDREAALFSFKSSLDQTLDCVFMFRPSDWRFLYANEGACRQVGYAEAELLRMTPLDLGLPFDQASFQELLRPLLDGTELLLTFESDHRLPSGARAPIELALQLVQPVEAEPRFVAIVRDISLRRQQAARSAAELALLDRLAQGSSAQAALAALVASYESIFPDMLCSILLLDTSGKRLHHYVAPNLPEAYCRAIDGIEIGPGVGSCGTAAFTRQRVMVADIATDPLWSAARELALPHGLRACWSIPILSSTEQVLGTFAAYYREPRAARPAEVEALERGAYFASVALERHQMLQSLHASKQRLETLIGNLPGMAYRCQNDADWTMTYVSDGCLPITGYRHDELEDNRTVAFGDLVHPDDRDELWQRCQESLAARRPCHNRYRIRDKAGAAHWVDERASGVHDEHGRLVYIDGFIRDITEARRSEQEHKDLERRMQETQRLESLGVLAGGVAHDFNNLLTAILGNASLALQHAPASSAQRESLEQINQAALRAADLCKQLLAYSGRGQFTRGRLDLESLLRDTTKLLRVSIGKRITLDFDLAGDLPAIEGDATQVRQVVMNLVLNASEAIGERAGRIVLRTRTCKVEAGGALLEAEGKLEPGRTYASIEVTDDGDGMSEQVRARIFEPFFTTKFTGRGLGLAAVQGIVHAHGGRIHARPAAERGTTFTVYLPAQEGPVGSTTATQAPTSPSPRLGGGTVLVVDDEAPIRGTVSRMLQTMGYRSVEAADGAEAVQLFSNDPAGFAAVLLDLTMPRMDGQQVLEALRGVHPDVRVIVMSGFSNQMASMLSTAVGSAPFLEKPFSIDDLRQQLRVAMA